MSMEIKKSGGSKHHEANKRSLAALRRRVRQEFPAAPAKALEKFTDAERAQGYKGRLTPRGGFTR